MASKDFSRSQARAQTSKDSGAAAILVPVLAEDAVRHKRRVVLSCIAAGMAVALLVHFYFHRKLDPLNARESFDAGRRFITVGRYGQAILALDRAVRLKPDFAEAYFMRGKAFVGDFKTASAIRDFSQVIALSPNDPRPAIDRALAYLELKDYASAIADADRALALNPKLAQAYNIRGIAIRELGDPRKALDQFNRAVELVSDTDNHFQRGATYQLLGEHDRAIADFDEVIAEKPDESPGYFARAESRRALGDIAGADQDHRYGRRLDGH